ncbi:unnamed protein product [Clonostachys chloroleuca]|uniref:Uncharacterized protein n=1 Tax=Clonostachys chloroleuca TaxID=1926264 RepID=A0AA35M9W9_9HYPO|nr:unnamed protein product [Clonostachys chloroleuca]
MLKKKNPRHLGKLSGQVRNVLQPGRLRLELAQPVPRPAVAAVPQHRRALVLVAHLCQLGQQIKPGQVGDVVGGKVQQLAEEEHGVAVVVREGQLERRRGLVSGGEAGALGEFAAEHGLEDGRGDGEDLGGDNEVSRVPGALVDGRVHLALGLAGGRRGWDDEDEGVWGRAGNLEGDVPSGVDFYCFHGSVPLSLRRLILPSLLPGGYWGEKGEWHGGW